MTKMVAMSSNKKNNVRCGGKNTHHHYLKKQQTRVDSRNRGWGYIRIMETKMETTIIELCRV